MELLSITDSPACVPDAATQLVDEHVRLAPLRIEHAEQLQPWVDCAEPGLDQTASSPADHGGSAAAFVAMLLERRATHGDVPFAVESLRTGELLGYTRYLTVDVPHRRLEIGGTWYRPDARGTAVNPATKALLLEHAFELCGFNRVLIQTDIRNNRSQRAILRIGATFEGIARADRLRRDGTVRDSWQASIVRTDWPKIREHLRGQSLRAPAAP